MTTTTTNSYSSAEEQFEPLSVPKKQAPKHLYRFAETALSTLTAPTEAALVRAIAERMLEHLVDSCGVRTWALISEPFEAELCQGDLVLAEWLAGGSLHDQPEIVVWKLHGQRTWLLAFRVEPSPDETTKLLLHLSKVVAQQLLSESGWNSLLDRARAIQQSLIPTPPFRFLAGFEVDGRSESAAIVGGDVFDIESLNGDASAVLLADASGHGLPAALQARDIVIGLRMGHENHSKIGATIEKLNRVLCGSTLSSQFVSLVYGELDCDGLFQYVNAGHPGPILLTRSSVEHLPQTGPVLGISSASRYRVAHAVLPPASLLVLYSDGVVECPDTRGEELGLERLVSVCIDRIDAPAAQITQSIYDTIAEHRGCAAVADDATVLVVKRN